MGALKSESISAETDLPIGPTIQAKVPPNLKLFSINASRPLGIGGIEYFYLNKKDRVRK